MILKGHDATAFLRAPRPAIRAVLIYGPDTGLVAERAAVLARAIVPDLTDPFRVGTLSASDLTQDPARLQDEAQALAMTGGRRVVRVRSVREDAAPLFEALLALEAVESLVVVEGGDLNPRSGLRKLFETAANAAALPCYADDAGALEDVVRQSLSEAGLRIEPVALLYLTAHLGSDRLVSRREIEKLILYKGRDTDPVSLADVRACVEDSATLALDDIVYAAAGGDIGALDEALRRAAVEGLAPIAILRNAAYHMQKLHLAVGHADRGADIEAGIRAVRPPIFFKRLSAFRAQARQWDSRRLAAALAGLTEAELRCKTTGMPERAICERALYGIAAAARSRRRA